MRSRLIWFLIEISCLAALAISRADLRRDATTSAFLPLRPKSSCSVDSTDTYVAADVSEGSLCLRFAGASQWRVVEPILREPDAHNTRRDAMATSSLDGASSMVAVNVDFRGQPTFAVKGAGSQACRVYTCPSEFVRDLSGLTAPRLLTFNGSRYVWPQLLQVVPEELRSDVKALALGSVDVMVCFFTEKGFLLERRRLSVAATSAPKGYRFPCDSPSRYDHESVCTDILGLAELYQATGRLYWLPKGRPSNGESAGKLGERRISAWVPYSSPRWLSVSECLAAWETHHEHPASFMNRPMAMVGGMVPASLLN